MLSSFFFFFERRAIVREGPGESSVVRWPRLYLDTGSAEGGQVRLQPDLGDSNSLTYLESEACGYA